MTLHADGLRWRGANGCSNNFKQPRPGTNFLALTNAISKIQIPAPTVDLTPLLQAIEKQQKPREWHFKIVRNQSGGIREVVATAE